MHICIAKLVFLDDKKLKIAILNHDNPLKHVCDITYIYPPLRCTVQKRKVQSETIIP
jgi:hypothetical protein